MNVVKTEVLVIGGGGAGSRAAIEADRLGADTILVCKGEHGSSGCTPNSASEWMAYGVALGLADPKDSREAHFQDIVKMGGYVCDHNLAKIIAYEAPERFYELVEWGVSFLREPYGKFRQIMSDGATYPRACGTGADTGRQIMDALRRQVNERGTSVIENTMAVDLLKENGVMKGAIGIDLKTMELTAFLAKSTIIATGGHGQLFAHNVFPPGMTGDGYAMALRAGAKLVNMEFMQMGPCVVTPFKFDVGGILWRLGPRLVNGRNDEYLNKYLPSGISLEEVYRLKSVTFPFTMRNASGYIDIANFNEIMEGRGTANQGVYFDLSHVSARTIEEKASIPFNYFLSKGVDIRKEPLEIAPSIQHMNGGILINEKAETTVPGLYAAGEAAGGQHGSDRPGGNSLADCQVFGARAGRYAAERSRKATITSDLKGAKRIEEYIRGLSKLKGRYDAGRIKEKLRQMMWRNVSVVRREETLREASRKLSEYRRMLGSELKVDKADLVKALELRNMVDVSLVVTKSALDRRETRGSHYRADYPERNDKEWSKIIEVQADREGLHVNKRKPNMIIYP